MSIYKVYLWTQVSCSSVLLLLYAATFIKVIRGSVYTFVLKLTAMLFLSNVATVFLTIANFRNLQSLLGGNVPHLILWFWVEGIAAVFQDSLFGLAHWIFAFEYYRISKVMPLVLKGIAAKSEAKDAIIFWLLVVLNILIPVIEGCVVIPLNIDRHYASSQTYPFLGYSLNITEYFVGAL
jgi:hypothetical protein